MKISRRQLKEILGDFIDYGYDDNYKSYYPSDYFHYNDILKFMHMNGEDASNPKVSYTEEELAQYKPLLKRQTSRLILLDKLDKNGHYDKYITYLYNQITNHAEITQRRDQQTIGENKMKITKRQLKRIIREEYSRLKSRGLIREMYDQDRVNDMIMYIDDMVMQADRDMGAYEMDDERSPEYYDVLVDINDPDYVMSKLRQAFPGASEAEIEEAMASF